MVTGKHSTYVAAAMNNINLIVLLFTVIIVLELLGEHKLSEVVDRLEAGTSREVAKVGLKS